MDQDSWYATSSSYAYTESPNSNLICCICRNPYVEPRTTRTCSHTFCLDCIDYAMRTSPHCPIDRSPLTSEGLTLADPIIRHLVDELVVECPQRETGCPHTCQRHLLASHLRDTCQFVNIPCPDPDCGQKILRKDAEGNVSKCVHRRVKCPDCASEIQLIELESHANQCPSRVSRCEFCDIAVARSEQSAHNASCPDYVIPCTHSSHGCEWTGTRRALSESHTATCPYEAIKGLLKRTDTQLSSLAEDNAQLRQRLHASEGMVEIMRRELEVVKAALGPWYRTGDPYPSWPSYPNVSSPGPLRNIAQETPAFLAERASSTDANPAPPPSTLPDIASYFPPALNDPYPSEHDITSRPTVPGPSILTRPPPLSPLPDRAPPQSTAPAHTTPVAPLNLSTTLPGALAGVRESVVTLAASHDALWRLTELALGNEAARTKEEVAALRAVVNGLRMQVHAMMMDRNALVAGPMGSPPAGEAGEARRGVGPTPGALPGQGGVWPSLRSFYPGPSHPTMSSAQTSTTKL